MRAMATSERRETLSKLRGTVCLLKHTYCISSWNLGNTVLVQWDESHMLITQIPNKHPDTAPCSTTQPYYCLTSSIPHISPWKSSLNAFFISFRPALSNWSHLASYFISPHTFTSISSLALSPTPLNKWLHNHLNYVKSNKRGGIVLLHRGN